MKKFQHVSLMVVVSLCILSAMTSCFSYTKCIVTDPKKQDEKITTNELSKFLTNRKNKPTVVLRVPAPSSNVTASDVEKSQLARNQATYDLFEKELLKAGFVVRDRGLLNSLLQGQNQLDYAQIGKKIQTDLIIEVLNLDFEVPNYVSKFKNVKTNEEIDLSSMLIMGPEPRGLNVSHAVFSYKIVMVDKGALGGMYTIYVQGCADGCEFTMRLFTGQVDEFAFKHQADKFYPRLHWTADTDDNSRIEVATHFAQQLIKSLTDKDDDANSGW